MAEALDATALDGAQAVQGTVGDTGEGAAEGARVPGLQCLPDIVEPALPPGGEVDARPLPGREDVGGAIAWLEEGAIVGAEDRVVAVCLDGRRQMRPGQRLVGPPVDVSRDVADVGQSARDEQVGEPFVVVEPDRVVELLASIRPILGSADGPPGL